jgi:endonuclease G, mitochondrial
MFDMMLKIALSFCLLLQFAHAASSSQIIQHQYYSMSYNNDHEVADWVTYELEQFHLRNCVQRSNSFRADPLVTLGSALPNDYKNSGFDRGHLVPAGDMKFDSVAMKETFFMSNMAPQPPQFNQGMWAKLEHLIRAWAFNYKKIWIATGPILRGNMPTIGNSTKISVPPEFYKVILRKEGQSYVGIAFIMNVDLPFSDLQSYTVSIDDVEDLTGIDFFKFLNSSQERSAEGDFQLSKWDFKAKFNYLNCDASVAQSKK